VNISRHPLTLPIVLCMLFFFTYTVLGIVKHNHFLSGYDLGVVHQVTWKYSQLKAPISTAHAYPFTSVFTDHVEFIYVLLAPFYWIFPDSRTLIVLQAFLFSSSGLAIWLLANTKKIIVPITTALIISYFMFFGVQFALWSDVHSLVFGVAFLAWFLYFLERKNKKYSLIFLVLTIICKEDLGLLTFLVSGVYFIHTRDKNALVYMAISVIYVAMIFLVYFPYFTEGYRFQNEKGILADISLSSMYDTPEKLEVVIYGLLSYGFLPILLPIYLIPALGDLAHYFVLGSDYVTQAQGLFGHYRSSLALLLTWPTIHVISKYKQLNRWYVAGYLLCCILFVQYVLHLPLSYLTKSWFWTESTSATSINTMLKTLPKDAAVVTQVNVVPHIGARDNIFLIWPDQKSFTSDSPCGKQVCKWFRWSGSPEYLIVDTSSEWDIRHLLSNREDFIESLNNIEKGKVIQLAKEEGTTRMYKVLAPPK
jgi:uncharacterized membrane protein